jgi:hypothetical protein
MKILYTDMGKTRRLSDCNLSEAKAPDERTTDGARPMYMIFNDTPDGSPVVTVNGKTMISAELRACFWESVTKALRRKATVFDVEKWYKSIRFITPEQAARRDRRKFWKKKQKTGRSNTP